MTCLGFELMVWFGLVWSGVGIGVIKLLSKCCVFCFLCYRLVVDQSKRLASLDRKFQMSVSFYGYNKTTQSFSEAEINLSNSNAQTLMDILGLRIDQDKDGDWAGSLSADDLLGRVLIAQAIMPADEGMPAHKLTGADYSGQSGMLGGLLAGLAQAEAEGRPSPSIWSAGRPAGYFDERLAQVRELAEEVKALGDDWVINWA